VDCPIQITNPFDEKLRPLRPSLLKAKHRGIELSWIEAVDQYYFVVVINCLRERVVVVKPKVGTKPADSSISRQVSGRDVTTSIPSSALEANVMNVSPTPDSHPLSGVLGRLSQNVSTFTALLTPTYPSRDRFLVYGSNRRLREPSGSRPSDCRQARRLGL
jgi:hypothetical protein